jgi:hypothetical protein
MGARILILEVKMPILMLVDLPPLNSHSRS